MYNRISKFREPVSKTFLKEFSQNIILLVVTHVCIQEIKKPWWEANIFACDFYSGVQHKNENGDEIEAPEMPDSESPLIFSDLPPHSPEGLMHPGWS